MEIANLSINENDTEKKDSVQYFYTGTSCMNVSTPHARAAVCICFSEDNNDSITELLDESLCTNQKAELHAIYRALSCIRDESNIHIISRSDYAVKCINVWSNRWKQDNWKNIPSNTIDNKSIVRSIVELIEDLIDEGKIITVSHSSSIPNTQGNNIAHNNARDALLNES